MTFDLRTRHDGPRPAVDAAAWLEGTLPALAAAAPGLPALLARLDPVPLLVEVDGAGWWLRADDGAVAVGPAPAGDAPPGAAHVRLSAGQFADLVDDQTSFMGLFSSGRLDQPAGRLGDLLDWWLVLRAAADGRPFVDPDGLTFTAAGGAPLDLHRAYRRDEDPQVLARALAQTGFLHLAGVFEPDEMAEISADMDRAAPTYADGDGRSWWATTADGTRRLVRLQGFDRHSPVTAALLEDERLTGLAALSGDGHRLAPSASPSRVEALVKPVGVVAGISDVPWHKDCSLGRHSYECCSITAGISVTGAGPHTGQLRVVAGSNRATVWPAFIRPGSTLPDVPLATATGDVTLHLSCTLHMAQPPVDGERRVLYTSFGLPPADPEAARQARARLVEVREAAPLTVSQESASGAGRSR